MKIVYQTDATGHFVGEVVADRSPREVGVFLIPAGCVEVAPPAAITDHERVWRDGAWIQVPIPAPETPSPPDLTAVRRAAVDAINAKSGQVRTLFITELPAQQMIYLAKEAEARAYLAATPADLGQYPLIAAEVGITADTALALAQLWVGTANQWRALAANIEGIRMSHIKMLGHPELTVEAAASVRDGAIAALDEIALLAP